MNVAAILEYLGTSVSREKRTHSYIGDLDQNTKQQYDALTWLDTRAKPAWATIVLNEEFANAWHARRAWMDQI